MSHMAEPQRVRLRPELRSPTSSTDWSNTIQQAQVAPDRAAPPRYLPLNTANTDASHAIALPTPALDRNSAPRSDGHRMSASLAAHRRPRAGMAQAALEQIQRP